MILKQFNNIKKDRINKIEKELEIKFPEDYRKFLLKYNGGIVEKNGENSIRVQNIEEEIIIDTLFGIVEEEEADISYWNQQMKEDMLNSALIIGDDIIQGFIVIICYGENKGVYYWDDAYNFKNSDDENNMYWIASSFNEFIKLLGKRIKLRDNT